MADLENHSSGEKSGSSGKSGSAPVSENLIFADRWVSSFSKSQQWCCRNLMLVLSFSCKHHMPREVLCLLTSPHPIPWQDHQLILAWYLEGICPRKDPKEAPCSKSLFSLTMWSLSSVSHELPDQACGPFPIHHGQVIPFSLHQLFMDKPFQRTTGLLGDVSHISKQGVWSSQFSFW